LKGLKIGGFLLAAVMLCNTLAFALPVGAATKIDYKKFNFRKQAVSEAVNLYDSRKAPVYDSEKGYGFVDTTSAMPERKVSTSGISNKGYGYVKTEDGTGSYIHNTNTDNYNYGGLVFRIDVDEACAYGITVDLAGCTSENTQVSVNGTNPNRILGSGYWDSGKNVKIQNHARWSDKDTWNYNFVSAQGYLEIEIEPKTLPTVENPVTVGVAGITLTKKGNNIRKEGELPTIYVLGDSTQKSYTFEEAAMSGWGQIISRMFDTDKVNVVNYSMGGRSMRNMYAENRFNDILLTANEGDYVFIHSAHNDESTGDQKGAEARFGRGSTTETYSKWLNDIYIPSLRARGLVPVLVTPMPRTKDGVAVNGFSPNAPAMMRAAAQANADVECVDLFTAAKKYVESIGPEQTKALYMSLEAGESPGKTNSGSYANGHPDNKIDGTHYKEALGKVWCKLIAEDIYNQSKGEGASESMKALETYLSSDVIKAAETGDWSEVYPEWANDVSISPDGDGYYYRNQIEKLLQLGVMFKDENGNFNPDEDMSVNEFISALCALWGLDVDDSSVSEALKKYYTDDAITREVMAAVVLDAYKLRFGTADDGSYNKPAYMTDYNGTTITPDNPMYDPNLTGEEAQYYPLAGWGNITDKDEISPEYADAFKTAYNLGLMRSENGIERGKMENGTLIEPKTVVTRTKAAKELWFLWVLGQTDVNKENNELTIVDKNGNNVNVEYQSVLG
jgi:lysophospholipase L1-like esterase